MQHPRPAMHLRRTNDTIEVFCEQGNRKVRPCDNRIKMTPEGEILSGMVLYVESEEPRYLCSWECAESYAKRIRAGGY